MGNEKREDRAEGGVEAVGQSGDWLEISDGDETPDQQATEVQEEGQTGRVNAGQDMPLMSDSQEDLEVSDVQEEPEEPSSQEQKETVILLDNGKTVSLNELKKSYAHEEEWVYRMQDLEQEQAVLKKERQDYVQSASELQEAYRGLTAFLETLVPEEPELELARSEPAEYQYRMALRRNAIEELEQICHAREEAGKFLQKANEEEGERYKREEEKKLLKSLPILKEAARRASFDRTNKVTALSFGFTEQEIDTTVDSRILQLVHYAGIGKIAEKNRQSAARRLVEKPRRGLRAKPAADSGNKNQEAIKLLSRTGRLKDAMAIDFE